MYATSLLIPYQTLSPNTESTSPRPSATESNSSTPSPSHHAPLMQTSYLASDVNGTNIELDTVMEETGENQKRSPVATIIEENNTLGLESTCPVVAGCKDQDDDAAQEFKVQDDITAPEIKGQNDAVPSESEDINSNTVMSLDSQEGAVADSTPAGSGVPNGELWTAEHQNGLDMSSSCGDRELANVLRQQPSSLVSIIEMKDLTHMEDMLLGDNGGPPPSDAPPPPPLTVPVVNCESKLTSTDSTIRSNSEPILPDRTTMDQLNNSGNDDGDSKCRATSKAALEKETGFTGKTGETTPVVTSTIENGVTVSRVELGVDGLPCSLDPLQKRMRELELKHRQEVEELRLSLKEAQLQVAEVVRLKQEERRRLHPEENGLVEEGERVCSDDGRPSAHSDDMVSCLQLHLQLSI